MGYRTVCFTFVRHAESETNASGRFSDDPCNPLTDLGRRQARNLAARWTSANVRVDALISSPMTRALDTANILANTVNAAATSSNNKDGTPRRNSGATLQGSIKVTGSTAASPSASSPTRLAVAIDGRLHERTYGSRVCSNSLTDLEVYRELRGTFNRVAPIRSYRPLGGGESYSDVAQRGIRFLLSVLQNPKLTRECAKPYDGRKSVEGKYDWRACELGEVPDGMPHVVVVSHNIFFTLLYEAVCQWNDADWDTPVHNWSTARDYQLSNCGWSRHVISWRPLFELVPEEQHQLKGNARRFGPVRNVDLQLGGCDEALLTY